MDPATAALSDIKLLGQPKAPPVQERGWKDTVTMYPGEVTRIVATFDREGLYVWHCHIVSHEDHEMMRPYYVGSPVPPWPYMSASAGQIELGAPVVGPASGAGREALRVEVYPNPFNPQISMRFELKAAGRVEAAIYDVGGRLVRRLADRNYPTGTQALQWDGTSDNGEAVSAGVYFLRMRAGGAVETRRLVMIK
jgi:spore coat protein A